jgi:hypothetical protein
MTASGRVLTVANRPYGVVRRLLANRRALRRNPRGDAADRRLCAALVHAPAAYGSDRCRARVLGARRRAFHRHALGHLQTADEDLREPPELLRETWKRENLPDDALEIPAIGETLLLDRTGAR